MGKFLDITGKKYWKLTAVKYVGDRKWLWKCDCGNQKVCDGRLVRKGEIKSCGCLVNEYQARRNNAGGKKNKYYGLWSGIKRRCFSKTDMHYPDYGARGISMAKEWQTDFWAFYEYICSLPHFEEEGTSLDRINNNGNYEPGNVRWATPKQQANNKRTSLVMDAFGKKQTCAEWAEEYGINYYTLWSRVFEYGMTAEEALLKPVR